MEGEQSHITKVQANWDRMNLCLFTGKHNLYANDSQNFIFCPHIFIRIRHISDCQPNIYVDV